MPSAIALYPCNGSPAANETYCKKEGKFQWLGEFTTQGKRTDIHEVDSMIQDGKTVEDIGDTYIGIYMRYYSSICKRITASGMSRAKDFRVLDVSIYSGETGSGKTRQAVATGGFMIHADDLQWWDGYQNEKTLIIDEYNNQVTITRLLAILDGYLLRLPVKGGFTYAQWTTVILTTNLAVLHENAKDVHREALDRRISRWVYFGLMAGSDR